MTLSVVLHASTQLRMPAPRGMASKHLLTFEKGLSENEIFISFKKGEMLSYMRNYKQKFGYKVKLMFLTTILKGWLHLIGYMEPPSGSI